MPPHGGGGHGGGGHHHGGGGGFPIWGGWWDGYPSTSVVVIDPSDDAAEQQHKLMARAMATIMSLPKAQRAGAYKKMFGSDAPAGALGDFSEWLTEPWFWGGAALGVAAVWFTFFRKRPARAPAAPVRRARRAYRAGDRVRVR
jgi:hypothetical protein